LNTRNKEAHICFEGQEEEIDRIAGSILIPDTLYEKFLKKYNYDSKKDIVDYAGKIGVAPFILIGRLLHDGYIDYKQFRDLIPPFDISAIKSA